MTVVSGTPTAGVLRVPAERKNHLYFRTGAASITAPTVEGAKTTLTLGSYDVTYRWMSNTWLLSVTPPALPSVRTPVVQPLTSPASSSQPNMLYIGIGIAVGVGAYVFYRHMQQQKNQKNTVRR